MELLMTALRRLLCLALCVGLAGCARIYRLTNERLVENSPWRYHHGDSTACGAVTGAGFDGKLDVVWETRSSGKPTGPLTIANGALVYPCSKARARFYDLATGKLQGNLKTKGFAQTGLICSGQSAFYGLAPRIDCLVCYDLRSRRRVWQQRVANAQGIVLIGGKVIVSEDNGRLRAFAADNGSQVWRYDDSLRLGAPPTVAGARLYQPLSSGYLLTLDPGNGAMLNRLELGGSLVAAAAAGDVVYVASLNDTLYAVDRDGGAVVWTGFTGGEVWSAPAVAHGRVVAATSRGEVFCLDAYSGDEIWRQDAGEAIKVSPIIVGDIVIAATLTGDVLSLRLDSGELVQRRELSGGVEYGPVSDGARVYVATRAGYVVALGKK